MQELERLYPYGRTEPAGDDVCGLVERLLALLQVRLAVVQYLEPLPGRIPWGFDIVQTQCEFREPWEMSP